MWAPSFGEINGPFFGDRPNDKVREAWLGRVAVWWQGRDGAEVHKLGSIEGTANGLRAQWGVIVKYDDMTWYDNYSYIYIYIYGTPARPTFQANLVVFTVFFLTFWTLKLRAFFGDQKLQIFASLFPSHPSLSTLDPRFKIPKTSWIRRPSALNLESKEVGLKKFFLSLESWILRPDT